MDIIEQIIEKPIETSNEETKVELKDEIKTENGENNFKNEAIENENKSSDENGIAIKNESNNASINEEDTYQEFLKQCNDESIATKLDELIKSMKLKFADLDENLRQKLKELNTNDLHILEEYEKCDLNSTEQNNIDLLKNLIDKNKSLNQSQVSNTTKPGPDEVKLKEILERTSYTHEVSSGQRKYGGPPPDWSGPMPGNGCEIFVGKLPKDTFEDVLIPLFEEFGKLWDLRIMIESSSGYTKGYAFITYCDKESAKKAADKLNDYEIKPGKTLRVNVSIANVRLFIGNIPKAKSKEEIKEEFSKLIEGVSEVIVYNPVEENNDKLKNRGFCFLDFDSHKSAAVARRKLMSTRMRIFNREIAVDWADPSEEPDEETMSKVKVLYVRNICAELTEDEVKKKFETYGSIERVRKVKDYAFVHYDEREPALKAMEELQGQLFGKNNLEISLARPLSDKKKQAQQKREEKKRMDQLMKNGNNNWNNYSSNQQTNNRSNGNNNRNNRGNRANNNNRNNNNNNNYNDNTIAAFGNFMKGIGFDNFEENEAFAMQFAAATSGQWSDNGNNNNRNRNNNNNNNMRGNFNSNGKFGQNRGGGGGGGRNNNKNGNNNRNFNNNNNNNNNNQFGKRKADQGNINRTKKGRFQNNNNNANSNIPSLIQNNNLNENNANNNSEFQFSGNQPIAQQPLAQSSEFYQDYYTPQWN